MKNLKKVLALVVALTMVLGTVCFAFTDVTAESDVYTAVQTLSSLSILNGYEDGSFGPEKDITRAEFAAVVCRALNMEASAAGAKGATQFADVPADHWASGYINLAAGQGIVNGYGNGNFGPEDNVTYEQAVKMLVVALGFEPMAAQKGGYPTGYLVVANTYGMTKGVKAVEGAAANRGIVAQLTHNALDIPVMEQTGFGTNVEYTIYDGNNKDYKTLLTGLEVAKLDGVVTATSVIGGGVEVNEVEFDIKDIYKNTKFTKGEKAVYSFAEGVNAAEYFGIASTIYLKEVKNDWEIISIMPGEDSAVINLDKGDLSQAVTASKLWYYESADATKELYINLELEVKSDAYGDVVINNEFKTLSDLNALDADAEISVIENSGNSRYDLIVAKDYKYAIVDDVEAERDRFTLDDASTFQFDFEDDTKSYVIVNKDGEAITLADFAAGDVIAYITKDEAKYDFAWCEIINLGQNVATGSITEVNPKTNVVYVDGVEYEIAVGAKVPKIGDEGMYYLTRTGKIFDSKAESSVASNYAYVLEMAEAASGFTKTMQIKLLTKEGEVVIYDLKEKVEVGNAVNSDGSKIVDVVPSDGSNLGFLAGVAAAGVNTATQFKTDIDSRLVTYKLSNGKISKIMPAAAYDNASIDLKGRKEYNANSMGIGGNLLADELVVFNLVSDDMDNAFVASLSSLVHEGEYDGILFKNEEGDIDAFVITDGKGVIDWAQDIAIIDSVNKITLNDDDAYKVRYYTSNEAELKEVVITDATDIEANSAAGLDYIKFADSLERGDIVMIADAGDGVAAAVAKIADLDVASDAVVGTWTLNNEAKAEIKDASNDEIKVVDGYIKDIKKTSNGINIITGSGSTITIKGSLNAYTFNQKTADRSAIVVGDWRGAKTIDIPTTSGSNEGKTYFVAITENGLVTDIITNSVRVK